MLQESTDLDFPPIELIDAQKSGELLIFCGAGVSMRTLPGYKGLVAEIAKQIVGIDLWGSEPADQQLKYLFALFNQNKLDAAVSFLESYALSQGNGHITHRKAITEYIRKRFYEQDSAAPLLDRHKRLLKLACYGTSLRLVTTNFDDFFERAFNALREDEPFDTQKIDCQCYHAPLLPPVQPTRWSGIIKLHGTLHPKPEDNLRDELILGSGDFGRAYLTERWASRFVTDLFRHFHVLFVGYSINDPVLRYIVDAYSLDAYHDTHLKCAYLLTSDKDAEETRTRFAGSNVKVHAYTQKDASHSGLDNLLQGWIDGYPISSVALKQRVTELARQSPTDPDTVRQLVKTLAHSTEAVKYFCDTKTDANIAWLRPLDDAGLLVAYDGPPPASIVHPAEHEKKNFVVPLAGSRWQYARTRVSESAQHFCFWLARNLDKREFIDWLLEKGGVMHPELRQRVVWQLWSGGQEYQNKGQSTPYESILHILTNPDINFSDRDDYDFYNLGRALKQLSETAPIPPEIKQKILWQLNTHICASGTSLTKGIERYSVYLKATDSKVSEESELARSCYSSIFELDTIKDHNQEQLQKWFQKHPKRYAEIAPDMYAIIKRTFDLLCMIGEGKYTYMQRAYIKAHEDNRGYADWDTLIDFTRDSLNVLWNENVNKASALVKLMMEEGSNAQEIPNFSDAAAKTGHVILIRLALHALTSEQCPFSPIERLKIAFPYQSYWLYSEDTQPEAADFLRSVWNKINATWQKRVSQAILVGDSRYKGKRSKKDRSRHQRTMLRRLRWIKEVTKSTLSERAEKTYAKLLAAYPGQDPFSETPAKFSMRWGASYAEEITYEKFLTFTLEQHLNFIDANYNSENTSRGWYEEGNNAQSLWQEWTQRAPFDALAMLQSMARIPRYPHIAWGSVLRKFGEHYAANPQEQGQLPKRNAMERKPLLAALQIVPDSVLTDDYKAKEGGFIREACDALKDFSRADGVVDFDKTLFLTLWRKLMSKARALPYSKGEDMDVYTHAINHPTGIITEALFHFMWQQSQGKYGEISISFEPCFDELFAEETDSLVLARAVLAVHLYPLHIFLPDWAERNALPWFNWDTNEKAAAAYWGAYMFNPRFSEKLANSLKPYLVKSFTQQRLEYFERNHSRENLVMMAALMMLDGEIDEADTRQILSVLSISDKASLVRLCANRLGGITDTAERKKAWEEIKAWLIKIQQISPFGGGRPSDELLELFLILDRETLLQDWGAIKGIIQPLTGNDLWMFYYHLLPERQDGGDATFISIWNMPELAIEMISLATPNDMERHPAEYLGKVLNKAREVVPNVENNPHFRRLLEIQTQCG